MGSEELAVSCIPAARPTPWPGLASGLAACTTGGGIPWHLNQYRGRSTYTVAPLTGYLDCRLRVGVGTYPFTYFWDFLQGKPMKSRSAKNKGRRLVCELRQAVLLAFPHLGADDIQLVPTSVGGEDLKLSPAARECWPFATECKNVERLNVWSAIAQAVENAGPHPAAVVFRRNRCDPWCAVPLSVMLALLERLKK